LVERFLADLGLPDPDALDGAVLALETSELIPHPGAVTAGLQALGERGLLGRFDGVLVGRPAARSHEEMYDHPASWRERYRERQREAIEEVFTRYNPDPPIVFDLEFGHTYPTAPIPIGGRVEIDPGRERIAFV
ncbi:MAG: LD-carboxypeptidase, partial [Halobacteriales archaeon]